MLDHVVGSEDRWCFLSLKTITVEQVHPDSQPASLICSTDRIMLTVNMLWLLRWLLRRRPVGSLPTDERRTLKSGPLTCSALEPTQVSIFIW